MSCMLNFCLDFDHEGLMGREFARMVVDFVKRVDLKPIILNSFISGSQCPGYALEREGTLPIFWLCLRGKKDFRNGRSTYFTGTYKWRVA